MCRTQIKINVVYLWVINCIAFNFSTIFFNLKPKLFILSASRVLFFIVVIWAKPFLFFGVKLLYYYLFITITASISVTLINGYIRCVTVLFGLFRYCKCSISIQYSSMAALSCTLFFICYCLFLWLGENGVHSLPVRDNWWRPRVDDRTWVMAVQLTGHCPPTFCVQWLFKVVQLTEQCHNSQNSAHNSLAGAHNSLGSARN